MQNNSRNERDDKMKRHRFMGSNESHEVIIIIMMSVGMDAKFLILF